VILSPNIIGRAARVERTRKTVKDGTANEEVTVIGVHAGGFLNRTVYFTVMYQRLPVSAKFFYTYPAEWLYFVPKPKPEGA
jgi:hypothetical protein